jgi:hypothetical protein
MSPDSPDPLRLLTAFIGGPWAASPAAPPWVARLSPRLHRRLVVSGTGGLRIRRSRMHVCGSCAFVNSLSVAGGTAADEATQRSSNARRQTERAHRSGLGEWGCQQKWQRWQVGGAE